MHTTDHGSRNDDDAEQVESFQLMAGRADAENKVCSIARLG